MAPSLEPSEEAIAGLRSLSLSREDAIKWLRVSCKVHQRGLQLM